MFHNYLRLAAAAPGSCLPPEDENPFSVYPLIDASPSPLNFLSLIEKNML